MSENEASMRGHLKPFRDYQAKHFLWSVSEDGRVATLTLNRPDRKNPLTFESYVELRDLFRDLVYASDVRTIVLTGAGGNFSSGGDVFEIIEPLTRMKMPDLLAFTRMTGDVVKAMRKCPQQIVAAIDGICVGAGAILPWFAHGITKTMMNQEWAMGIDEMIESEAQAQAICMATGDFRRAFEAFAAKQKPVFEGN